MDIRSYIESGILEAYVLGTLPESDAVQVLNDIRMYPELAEEVEVLEQTLWNLASSNAVPPPPGLDEKIWDKINSDVATNTGAEPQYERSQPRLIPFFPGGTRWNYAAIWIVLVGSLVLNVIFWLQYSEQRQRSIRLAAKVDTMAARQQELVSVYNAYSKNKAMMADTSMQTIVLHTVLKGHPMAATLFMDKTKREGYIVMDGLPHPPGGMQYQLWAIKDGKPVNMGVLPNEMAGKAEMTKINQPMEPGEAYAISLEKEGGSDVPTTQNIYVLGRS